MHCRCYAWALLSFCTVTRAAVAINSLRSWLELQIHVKVCECHAYSVDKAGHLLERCTGKDVYALAVSQAECDAAAGLCYPKR